MDCLICSDPTYGCIVLVGYFVTKELARVSSKDGEVPESLEANFVDEC